MKSSQTDIKNAYLQFDSIITNIDKGKKPNLFELEKINLEDDLKIWTLNIW